MGIERKVGIGRKFTESALVALAGGIGLVAILELAGYYKNDAPKPLQLSVQQQPPLPALPVDDVRFPLESSISDTGQEKKQNEDNKKRVAEAFAHIDKNYLNYNGILYGHDNVRTFFSSDWKSSCTYSTTADTLGGFLISHYASTQDDYAIRAAAQTLERNGKLLPAFVLYDTLGDKDSLQRIATAYFIFELSRSGIRERLFEQAGTEPTPTLFNQRADTIFAALDKTHLTDGDLDNIFCDYKSAKNQEKMQIVAKLGEEKGFASFAFRAYTTLGDAPSALRCASIIFVSDGDSSPLHFLGASVSPDLWNQRGDYLFNHRRYKEALDVFTSVGNKEKALISLQKALEPNEGR